MPRRLIASVLLCTLACFGMLGLAAGLHWSPKLGLDLEGGLSVVYKPNKTVDTATLDNVTNIIQERINALGVSQPNVTTQGKDIVVQLPGVKDAARILPIIGQTAELYVRPVLSAVPPYTAPKAPLQPPTGAPATCPSQYQETAATYNASQQSNQPPSLYTPLAVYPSATPATDDPTQNVLVPAPESTDRYLLGPSMINGQIVTGTIIKSAYSQFETTQNQWVVVFNLTSKGSTLFNAIAKKYYQTQVADDLDGVIVSAPVHPRGQLSRVGSDHRQLHRVERELARPSAELRRTAGGAYGPYLDDRLTFPREVLPARRPLRGTARAPARPALHDLLLPSARHRRPPRPHHDWRFPLRSHLGARRIIIRSHARPLGRHGPHRLGWHHRRLLRRLLRAIKGRGPRRSVDPGGSGPGLQKRIPNDPVGRCASR